MSSATPVVADTQMLIWYVIDPDRLTAAAAATLDAATDADLPIYVSAYSLVELVYAVEKATNPLTEDDRQAILEELTRNDTPFEVLPVRSVLLVVAADKLHNCRSLLADIDRDGTVVFDRFNAGAADTVWLYRSIVTVLSEKLPEEPMVTELAAGVERLAGRLDSQPGGTSFPPMRVEDMKASVGSPVPKTTE